ncbi:APH(3') family aminoglycoside O-phosphotransferase [Cohnella sp. GCM10020058]|uniref:APH(3') family aminoglycoside O-phosphotransferase n=1 Tax=Cohnella sp. GCM10020058 TaxID=3317330 RepID=UPI00363AAF98
MTPEQLPQDLLERIGPVAWHRIAIGQSGARTYRLECAEGPSTYMKIADVGCPDTLRAEADRLAWLRGKLPVPALLDYRQLADREMLWMSEVPGIHAADASWSDRPHDVARAMAAGLRHVHALDIQDCPFDQRVQVRIREAGRRLAAGFVDADDFDSERAGCSADELFAQLLATVPPDEDLVFTHGDYTLPNVMLDEELRTGFIDWGRSGIGDRYQDIALAARSLAGDYGPSSAEVFLSAYGLSEPDRDKLEFYRLLDEFF